MSIVSTNISHCCSTEKIVTNYWTKCSKELSQMHEKSKIIQVVIQSIIQQLGNALHQPNPNSNEIVVQRKRRAWTANEKEKFCQGLRLFGRSSHREISMHIGTKSRSQVRSFSQYYFKKRRD